MEVMRMIDAYLEYCESKQLRPRTIGSYRQALELFAVWLKESEGIEHIEDVKDATIRRYIMNLQQRGEYTAVSDDAYLLFKRSTTLYLALTSFHILIEKFEEAPLAFPVHKF